MNLFIDANILIAVLNKELDHYGPCARILSLAEKARYSLVTSPLCLAISFYYVQKKSGEAIAKSKIALLLKHFSISDNDKSDAVKTLENKKIHDFEDGLEYYSAVSAKCDCIITLDTDDFYFSDIEVLKPADFLVKYIIKK